MLPLKHDSWFENPSRHVFLVEGSERWTDKTTGKSTAYAEKVAEKTKTERSELAADVLNAIPKRTDLTLLPHVTAKEGDTLTGLLKENLPAAKYNDKNLLRLSYGHMFKEAKKIGGDINFLAPGDMIQVINGVLFLIRGAKGLEFNSDVPAITVTLYPWPEATPTAPTEPAGGGTSPGDAPPTPVPVEPTDDARPPRIGA